MKQSQVDLRKVTLDERPAKVFQAFDSLTVGDSFVVLIDHDPKALLKQLKAERPGIFQCDYAEKGPQLWQVRIAKVASEEGCCGICGNE